MLAVYMWYYVINIFGMLDWSTWSSNKTKTNYNYGFYQMPVPIFLFSFFQANLFVIAYWTRLRYKHEATLGEGPERKAASFAYWN